jgi:23S rRNA (uracil1939-C5)-methyltransferase
LELTIEKLIYGGDGLARLPADEHGSGKAAFVPFVLEGEKVEAALVEEKKGFARARVEKLLSPSPARIDPSCPYFARCGGCHYQHTSYGRQLEIKVAILKENLRRMAKLELNEIQVHASPAWNYRNRTRLKVRTRPEFAAGYFKFNSHELQAVEECPISSPLINRAITKLWELGRAGGGEGIEEIEFFANAEDTQLLVEIYCGREGDARGFAGALKKAIAEICGIVLFPPPSVAKAHHISGLAGTDEAVPSPKSREQHPSKGEGQRPLKGKAAPETRAVSDTASQDPQTFLGFGELAYKTKQASYRVSAGAFFQVNRHLTDELVSLVTEGRSGKTALDVYAGVGLFSTVLSREFEKVIAVEASPISHGDLLYNSPANVKAVQGMSEQYLKNVSGKLRPDLVVVDPPRSGLGDSVIHSLVNLGAPRMTYVSCDPATLSRDLAGLLKAGYRVEQAHLVDLFPQTYHLESVFHLVR